MYKQILIATDGSESSQRAIHHGVGLAQAVHCHVTAISVCRPWSSVAVSEFGFAIAPGEYDRACKAAVERNLRAVKQAANSAAVSCNTIHVTHPNPWQAIIDGPLARAFEESLIIVGWVANWKPIETFLYDWWPLRRRRDLYRRLQNAAVEINVG